MKYLTTVGDQEYNVEIVDENNVVVNGELFQVDFNSIDGQPVFSLLVDGRSYEAYVYPAEEAWQVLLKGRSYTVTVVDEREKRIRATSGAGVGERKEFNLKAPMPGLVISVPVSEGQEISVGEVLIVLESMKMQNELRAPRQGRIARLRVSEGDNVEQNETLLSVV